MGFLRKAPKGEAELAGDAIARMIVNTIPAGMDHHIAFNAEFGHRGYFTCTRNRSGDRTRFQKARRAIPLLGRLFIERQNLGIVVFSLVLGDSEKHSEVRSWKIQEGNFFASSVEETALSVLAAVPMGAWREKTFGPLIPREAEAIVFEEDLYNLLSDKEGYSRFDGPKSTD